MSTSTAATTTDSILVSRTPILLRPRNFQWYWNSATDPCSSAEEWLKYTAVENEIIEDAYDAKNFDVEIDGDYVVNLEHQVQYKKGQSNKQSPVKRVTLQTDRSNVHLREERFALPVVLSSEALHTETSTYENGMCFVRDGEFPMAYANTKKTFGDVVMEAAAGIWIEGTALGKQHEAYWLAQQLLAVKHFAENDKARRHLPLEVGETCVYLYTKESFWYKLLNRVLRNPDTITPAQLTTLGPFCYLLNRYLQTKRSEERFTVYRGLTVADEQQNEFMKDEDIRLTSFTSTSRNLKKAEQFGNTLLVIDLNPKYILVTDNVPCGTDVSLISDFPDEEEFLIWPATSFHFVRYEYDSVKKKHIIHLVKAGY